MMEQKILVVDDEREIADLVEVYLTNEGFSVFKAYTATEALEIVAREELSLAILDVMLPDMNGFTLCQKIREEHLFPILILSAKVEDMDCSATSFLRNWDSILEKKRANLRSISEPARLRQPPPRSTGAAHARGRAQSIREERRIAAPPVLFALLWVRLLPALYGPFCGPLRPFGGCPWGVTPPARECLPPAPPDTRRRG